ncbi:MAG: sugar phosphate isomerase/epimerase family protein [Pirellulaceae bacterium]
MKISRRELLQWGSGTAAALLAGVRPLSAMANLNAEKIPIGLQLYSVREDCEKDLAKVLQAVADMGYRGVEFAGYYNRTAHELHELLHKHGLQCCGTHISLDTLKGDELKKTVEFNKTIDNKYLIVSWMPESYAESLDAVKEMAKVYDDIAAQLKEQGMYVGYHAHAGDFKKIGDEFAWDLFFANTCSDVVMQMDLGNCLEAGGDPIASLKRFPGRSQTIHLKEAGGPDTAVVGEGDVNWKEVFEICESTGGTKWYIVEHERPAGTPLRNVSRCLRNLQKMGK